MGNFGPAENVPLACQNVVSPSMLPVTLSRMNKTFFQQESKTVEHGSKNIEDFFKQEVLRPCWLREKRFLRQTDQKGYKIKL